jgi:integrase
MHESRRRYVYGQTRREVVEKPAELKKQQEQGADFSVEKQRAGALEHVQKFLADVKGHRLEAMYLIAVVLGLHQGEILGLRREDVDLDKLSCVLTVKSCGKMAS